MDQFWEEAFRIYAVMAVCCAVTVVAPMATRRLTGRIDVLIYEYGQRR
jgi:hypothetical protein